MGFAIKIGDGHFVKRTAHFGMFHGRLILTTNPNEKRVWTRKQDADNAARVVSVRRNRAWDMNKVPPGEVTVVPE